MLVRQNLLKEAVIRLLVACQTLSSSAERVLEEREDACAGIAKVEQGKIWFSNHSASGVVGPVLVSKETSDIVKVGWDVSASTSCAPARDGTCPKGAPSTRDDFAAVISWRWDSPTLKLNCSGSSAKAPAASSLSRIRNRNGRCPGPERA